MIGEDDYSPDLIAHYRKFIYLIVYCKYMATSDNFSEYYKTISNTELLSILENSDEYQVPALEAAKKEFANRQLSEAEIQDARQILIVKQEQKEKEWEKIKIIETKIKAAGNTFIDTINPIQSGIPSAEKTIRLVVIVFGGIFIYQFVKDFRTHIAYIKDIPRFPFESILYFLPQILLPIAIFTFWKRKKIGWTLLTIFLTFSAVEAIWLLIEAFTWKSSGFAGLDMLFPRPSPTTYIIQLLFLAATLYVLCKTNIREVFSVDKQKMGATIAITGFVTFLLVLI